MRDALIEIGIEVSMFLLYGAAATLLAGVGTALEYRSYLFFGSGQTAIALYAAGLGLVLLTLAYRISRDKMSGAWTDLHAKRR